MLPVIDYGDIAVVIPNVSAVGSVVKINNGHGFEVYLNGKDNPIVIGFFDENDAEESRRELIGIIAQYYFAREYGPDFELEDLMENIDESEIDELDEDVEVDENNSDDDKHEH